MFTNNNRAIHRSWRLIKISNFHCTFHSESPRVTRTSTTQPPSVSLSSPPLLWVFFILQGAVHLDIFILTLWETHDCSWQTLCSEVGVVSLPQTFIDFSTHGPWVWQILCSAFGTEILGKWFTLKQWLSTCRSQPSESIFPTVLGSKTLLTIKITVMK